MRKAFFVMLALASACGPTDGSDQSSENNHSWPPKSSTENRRTELPNSLLGDWTLSTPPNDSVPLAISFTQAEVAQDWSQLARDRQPYIQTGQIMDIVAYPDSHVLMVHAVPLNGMYLQRGEPGEICLIEPLHRAGQPPARKACYRRKTVGGEDKAEGGV